MSNPQIKFRAWTGSTMMYQDKQYLTSFLRRVTTQIILDNQDIEPRVHEAYLPKNTTIEDYLQQYTGFKDKNGKEVYIGDIIDCNYTWWGQPMHEQHEVELSKLMQILPFHQAFSYGSDRRLWIDDLINKFEVVGNIYENADLLNRRLEFDHGQVAE